MKKVHQLTRAARLAAALGVVTATLALGASASAASDPAAETAGEVAELATDAADLLIEEQRLLADPGASPADLVSVDARGADILVRLDQLGVDVTRAARTALSRLPSTADRTLPTGPPAVVYEAAIEDLGRIAATPEAVIESATGDGGRGELIGVAMAVAIALALVLRSTRAISDDADGDDDDDLSPVAWRDPLTGVASRRRLDRDLELIGSPEPGPTAALLVDVDGLAAINDRYGHEAGDEVLCSVADLLIAHVREQDVVYRFGNDEFCILMLGASEGDAGSVADRIASAAYEIELPDGSPLSLSVDIVAGDPSALLSASGA